MTDPILDGGAVDEMEQTGGAIPQVDAAAAIPAQGKPSSGGGVKIIVTVVGVLVVTAVAGAVALHVMRGRAGPHRAMAFGAARPAQFGGARPAFPVAPRAQTGQHPGGLLMAPPAPSSPMMSGADAAGSGSGLMGGLGVAPPVVSPMGAAATVAMPGAMAPSHLSMPVPPAATDGAMAHRVSDLEAEVRVLQRDVASIRDRQQASRARDRVAVRRHRAAHHEEPARSIEDVRLGAINGSSALIEVDGRWMKVGEGDSIPGYGRVEKVRGNGVEIKGFGWLRSR